jgi:sec-independent protein translocase protein TatB
MFGMGFIEIVLILVVAVIALGPEKLPNAAVDIAKMIKKLKSSVDDVKSNLDSELNVSGMKSEAEKFKDSMGIDRLNALNMDSLLDENEDDPFEDKKRNKEQKKNKKIDASYAQAPKVEKQKDEKIKEEEIKV